MENKKTLTEQELIQGYETEIHYQKRMIDNLGRWFSLFFAAASVGFVLIYLFGRSSLLLLIIGLIVTALGILAMLLFGYGIYRGRLNLQRVINDFEEKLQSAK